MTPPKPRRSQRPSNRALPLVQFRAFEAVARHRSFSAAAGELALTQSAVSRQVIALEHEVGVKLLVRHTRSVELSNAGQRLLDAVVPSLHRIDTTVRQIRAQADRPSIVVTTWASFATIWLIPRLEDFRAQHPGIDIHVRTTDASIDLEVHAADIALRYTRAAGVPPDAPCMFEDQVVAVASPRLVGTPRKGGNLAAAPLAVRSPRDLQHATLIEAGDTHTNQRLEWLTWHGWARAHQLAAPTAQRWMYFDYSHQVVQACLAGQGIALSRLVLVADQLARGELVEVLPRYRLASPMGYWLIRSPRTAGRPEVDAFCAWLLEQARVARAVMGKVVGEG